MIDEWGAGKFCKLEISLENIDHRKNDFQVREFGLYSAGGQKF